MVEEEGRVCSGLWTGPPGKQSGMEGSSAGSRRNVDLLEAPRHKVFSIIFEWDLPPGRILDDSASDPESGEHSPGKDLCGPPLQARAAPDSSAAAGDALGERARQHADARHRSAAAWHQASARGSVFQACKS